MNLMKRNEHKREGRKIERKEGVKGGKNGLKEMGRKILRRKKGRTGWKKDIKEGRNGRKEEK